MLKLLKNADVYAPQPLGRQDILIADEKIMRVAPDLHEYEAFPDVEVLDAGGKRVAPRSPEH